MNQNPSSNLEVHTLFEHGFQLENTPNCLHDMKRESVEAWIDHFANALNLFKIVGTPSHVYNVL